MASNDYPCRGISELPQRLEYEARLRETLNVRRQHAAHHASVTSDYALSGSLEKRALTFQNAPFQTVHLIDRPLLNNSPILWSLSPAADFKGVTSYLSITSNETPCHAQVLMSLPAPPPRPILRPLPQSELNSLANPGLNPGAQPAQELWIPAVSEPSYLAPSKMDVHRLHVDGLSIEEIAVKKGVRLTTVESYLVEAMQAGLAYPWHRLGVSDAVRERVEGAVSAELELVGEGEVERQVEAQGSVESRSSENGGQPKRVRGALTGIPVKCGEPSRGSEERGFLQSGGIERTTADVGSIREVAAQRSRVSGRLNGDVRNGAGPSTVQEQTAFLPPEDGANSSGCISQGETWSGFVQSFSRVSQIDG